MPPASISLDKPELRFIMNEPAMKHKIIKHNAAKPPMAFATQIMDNNSASKKIRTVKPKYCITHLSFYS
nr:MAG TPA: hypothetical protein [Inoviridae sp.]